MSFWCKIGLHHWEFKEKWYPSFSSPVVTKCEAWAECSRCGKKKDCFIYKDWETRPEDWVYTVIK
jgi:hypothetical protein